MELTEDQKAIGCAINSGSYAKTMKTNSKKIVSGTLVGLFVGFCVSSFIPNSSKVMMSIAGAAVGGIAGFLSPTKIN